MKKLLIGFLALSLVLLSFVSCNSNAVTLEDGVGTVSFNEMQATAMKSLSASVDYPGKANYYWRYTAVKKDSGGKIGQWSTLVDSKPVVYTPGSGATEANPYNGSTWEIGMTASTGQVNTHIFSVGTWEFTLYAFATNTEDTTSSINPGEEGYYSYEANYIYKGTATAVVEASKTKTVTIGVSGVSSGTGTGTVAFSGITRPTGYAETTILKYKVDSGDYSVTVSYPGLTLGSHTVYVGVFNDNTAATPLVSSSINVTVYRGLTTTVSGSVDEQTGGVQFDVSEPVSVVVTKTETATQVSGTSTYESPATTLTSTNAPDKTVAGSGTTVSIPAGAITPSTTPTAETTFKSDLKLTTYSATASSTFSVQSGNVAVAGIDCKLTVTETTGTTSTTKEVTNFGDEYVTVSTYIVKNLTAPKIFYDGSTGDKPIAVNLSDFDDSGNTSQQEKYDAAVASGAVTVFSGTALPENKEVGYCAENGKLIFKTNHFSTFHVEMNVESIIVETNTAYQTLKEAVAAASSGQTVKVLKDFATGTTYTDASPYRLATAGVTIDLNGYTITETNNFSLILGADNMTLKNGKVVSGENNGKQCHYNSYALIIGAATENASISNVIVKDVTFTGGVSVGGDTDTGTKGGASVTFENCSITSGDYYAIAVQRNSTAQVMDGRYNKIEATVTDNIIWCEDGSALTLYGGTYNRNPSGYANTTIPSTHKVTENGSPVTSWTISKRTAEDNPVAKIGDNYYASLRDAAEATSNGDTVKIVSNYTFGALNDPDNDYVAIVFTGTGVTLDLDGKTLTCPKMSCVLDGVNLTIKNGTFAGTASYPLFVGDGNDNSSITVEDISVTGGINIYKSNVTLNNVTADASAKAYYAIWAEGGSTVSVVSGTYKKGASGLVIEKSESTITLTGGTFDSDPSAYVANGYRATANETSPETWTVHEYVAPTPTGNVFTANTTQELTDVINELNTNSAYTTGDYTVKLGAGTIGGTWDATKGGYIANVYVIKQFPKWNGYYGNGATNNNTVNPTTDCTRITVVGSDTGTTDFKGAFVVVGWGYSNGGDYDITAEQVRTEIKNLNFNYADVVGVDEASEKSNFGNATDGFMPIIGCGASTNMMITGCNFTNIQRIKLGLVQSSGPNDTDNLYDGNGKVAVVKGYSFSPVIKDCTFTDCDTCFDGYFAGSKRASFTNVTATDCDAFVNAQQGNTNTITIKDSDVTCSNYLIRTNNQGAKWTFDNCTINITTSDPTDKYGVVTFRGGNTNEPHTITFDNCTFTSGSSKEIRAESGGTYNKVIMKGTSPKASEMTKTYVSGYDCTITDYTE